MIMISKKSRGLSGSQLRAVRGYAVTSRGPDGKVTSLHRLLVSPKAGNVADHKSGVGLDNRRCNMRECSHKENLRNKKKQPGTVSRFKGVSITKSGPWRSKIEQNGVKLTIGCFASEIKAAQAYDTAAKVLFGSFAKTNESLGLFDGADDRVLNSKRESKNHFAKEMSRIGIVPRFAA